MDATDTPWTVNDALNLVRRRIAADPVVGTPSGHKATVINIENVGRSALVLDLDDGTTIRFDAETYKRADV